METAKLITSVYHPQTDGQVERFNRTLKGLLTSFVNDCRNDWDIHLSMELLAYRNSRHASTEVSSFLAVHGREAGMPPDFSLNRQESNAQVIPVPDYVDQVRQVIQKTHEQVTASMEKAQQQQRKSYNKRFRTPVLHTQRVRKYGSIFQLF